MHKLNDICCLKEDLIAYAMEHKDCCDIPSYGQIIDMIKDLYEAEKYCFEACYFKTATEELRQEELEVPGRHGYDHWRTSSGRFARKGTGHYSPGYPRLPMIPNDMRHDDIYGYPNGDNGNGNMSNNSSGYPYHNRKMVGRYGYPMDEMKSETYNEWNDARRHYHDAKDPASKQEMDEHGMKHVKEVVETSRDIYKEASPEMRQKLKNEFTKMMADFNATP